MEIRSALVPPPPPLFLPGASWDWEGAEDFYLRRKQIPSEISISVGITLRGRLARLSEGASEIIWSRVILSLRLIPGQSNKENMDLAELCLWM